MANVDLITGTRSTFFESFSGVKSSIKQATNNSFTLRANNGQLSQVFSGSFDTNKRGRIKGRITSFSVLIDDQLAWTVSDLDLSVNAYNRLFTTGKQAAFDGLFGGDDTFSGSDESERLFSYAGNDNINANGGDDIVDAGIGDDSLIGGQGSDSLFGGDGEDILDGGEGFDYLDGGVDADLLTGGNGNDVFITRDGASPELTAIEFTDTYDGLYIENYTLFAGNGIDIITDFNGGVDVISDTLSVSGEIVTTPFRLTENGPLNPGDVRVLRGEWIEDTLASGLNRGRFELVNGSQSEDLLLFVVTEELAQVYNSRQDLARFDPSIFGSQLFVILGTDVSGFGSE